MFKFYILLTNKSFSSNSIYEQMIGLIHIQKKQIFTYSSFVIVGEANFIFKKTQPVLIKFRIQQFSGTRKPLCYVSISKNSINPSFWVITDKAMVIFLTNVFNNSYKVSYSFIIRHKTTIELGRMFNKK